MELGDILLSEVSQTPRDCHVFPLVQKSLKKWLCKSKRWTLGLWRREGKRRAGRRRGQSISARYIHVWKVTITHMNLDKLYVLMKHVVTRIRQKILWFIKIINRLIVQSVFSRRRLNILFCLKKVDFKKENLELCIVTHTFDPTIWETEAGGLIFMSLKSSLATTVNFRPPWTIERERDPVSKKSQIKLLLPPPPLSDGNKGSRLELQVT